MMALLWNGSKLKFYNIGSWQQKLEVNLSYLQQKNTFWTAQIRAKRGQYWKGKQNKNFEDRISIQDIFVFCLQIPKF
jgi:hypothetical protein